MSLKLLNELYVTCNQGFEQILGKEIQSYGYPWKKGTRGVLVHGFKNEETLMDAVYKINYESRVGLRVLAPILKIKANQPQQLHQRITSEIPWKTLFPSPDRTLAVDAFVHPENKNFKNSLYVCQVVKDAVVDSTRKYMNYRPSVDTTNPDVQLHILISEKGECTLSYDTSGKPLNMRNYRVKEGEGAPLRETIAAGIIDIANINEILNSKDSKNSHCIYDPCCGSGTLLIESYLKLTNTPSGYLRNKWGFQNLPNYNKRKWESIKSFVNKNILELQPNLIMGTDISQIAVQSTIENFKKFGVTVTGSPSNKPNTVIIAQKDFREFEFPIEPSIVISNLPYGERISDIKELQPIYRQIASIIKNKVKKGGNAFLLVPNNPSLYKYIYLSYNKKYVINNGGIDTRLFSYTINPT